MGDGHSPSRVGRSSTFGRSKHAARSPEPGQPIFRGAATAPRVARFLGRRCEDRIIERNRIGMDWEVRFHARRQAIACVVLMVATGLPCRGRAADAATEAELRSLQWDLVWTGHYEATVDSQPGPTTRRAIRSYQASIGLAADGELSASNATGSPRGRPPCGHSWAGPSTRTQRLAMNRLSRGDPADGAGARSVQSAIL